MKNKQLNFEFEGEKLIAIKEQYQNNKTLAVLVLDLNDEYYIDLSTNINSHAQDEKSIFVKVGDTEEKIALQLADKGFLEPTPIKGESGNNRYRLYRVNF